MIAMLSLKYELGLAVMKRHCLQLICFKCTESRFINHADMHMLCGVWGSLKDIAICGIGILCHQNFLIVIYIHMLDMQTIKTGNLKY